MSIDTILNDRELALKIDKTGKMTTAWSIKTWMLQDVYLRLGYILTWIDNKKGELEEKNKYGVICKINKKDHAVKVIYEMR